MLNLSSLAIDTSAPSVASDTSGSAVSVGDNMYVVKRNGNREEVLFDKILARVKTIGVEAGIQHINYTTLTMKVIEQLYDGITTTHIDELLAQQCAMMMTTSHEYETLASRIAISNYHKNTNPLFVETLLEIEASCAERIHCNLYDPHFREFIEHFREQLNQMPVHDNDNLINYFGFNTLLKGYLLKKNGVAYERPQHLFLRVAVALHCPEWNRETSTMETDTIVLQNIRDTYLCFSNKYYTHATPTLFNAGMARQQLSSCFLNAMEDDSIDGIYNTLKDCAMISKHAGGLAVHIHNIRSRGAPIGNSGNSTGIVPMLRVFNATAKYVDQGGGKRAGSIAVYLEPWHADIMEFLDLRKTHGDEDARTRELFTALWIPDLFMQRVREEGQWSLFSPDACKGLSDAYGDAFVELYEKYEREGKAMRTMKARDVWTAILDSQMETGTPYMLYKDAVNKKSNQQNLGTIKSSNLCCEIVEYSDDKETAVCNLASIGLPSFVDETTGVFRYEELERVVGVAVENLDRIIDINYYPTEKTRRSNMRHRPIGLGVQGLADMFLKMGIAFYSEEALQVNRLVFETMYYAAVKKSCELAQKKGSYSTFEGSPMSRGVFQFDMWGEQGTAVMSGRYDWEALRKEVATKGLRNSQLIAHMPTASTSQILGFNECFEPYTSNIYTRRTLSGDFIVINRFMMKELEALGVWSKQVKDAMVANNGSIQHIVGIPTAVKEKYRTVWEIPMKQLIQMAADRSPFTCQSQSMNLWMADPDYKKLTSMHFFAWGKGLKTGLYYLRRQPKHRAQQFTIAPAQPAVSQTKKTTTNTADDSEVCTMCSA